MSTLAIIFRLLLSAVLGGLVGVEREIHGRAAGLRTHILVCVGSTLFMVTSVLVSLQHSYPQSADPSRIAAGVVTGIGFLGAGAIIRFGTSIKGLTTAASIWAVAAVGLAVGAGLYVAAAVTTGVVLVVLFLSRVEERMELKRCARTLRVNIDLSRKEVFDEVKKVLGNYGIQISHVVTEKNEEGNSMEAVFEIVLSRARSEEFMAELISLPGILNVKMEAGSEIEEATE